MALTNAALTHPGHVRKNNEDAFLVRPLEQGAGCLAAVADGAGGEAAGEVASAMAIEVLAQFNAHAQGMEAHLAQLVAEAHQAILHAARETPRLDGMGSTLTVFLVRQGHMFWAHVGDSRLYLFSRGELLRLTPDHTVAGALLAQGDIDEERARTHPMRNYLLQCLGCPKCEPESGVAEVAEGDIVMACSDGLHGELTDPVLAAVLAGPEPLQRKVQALMDQALDAGGSDNVTLVAVEI